MFRGRHEHAIDVKGRTSLPSRFREALATTGDSRIVMMPDFRHPYLRVYPMPEWIRQEAALSDDLPFDESLTTARRFSIGDAVDCEVDKLGRVLIPASLREHAAVEREVVWVGVGRWIELWDKRGYEEMRARVRGNPAEMQSVVEHLAVVRAK